MKKINCISIIMVLLAWLIPLDAVAANVYGDVNGDGEVNIADINAVIDVILGGAIKPGADVNNDGEVNIADINAVIDVILNPAPVEEHEWVDLGLPSGTLWATCNVGANAPEEYGDFFAWGETEPKELYSWSTYKWCDGNQYAITKYCTSNSWGTVDNRTELEPEDDAASVNWGPSWCMPSSEQQEELAEKCTWTWTTINGEYGYLVTGPNGNTLFLPTAGGYEEIHVVSEGEEGAGCYWSRTLRTDFPSLAYNCHFNYWGVYCSSENRFAGYSVRAVRVLPAESLFIEQENLIFGEVPIGESRTRELTITNRTTKTQTLTVTADAPFLLQQEEESVSSMTVVLPAMSSSTVTVIFTAITPGEYIGNITFQNPVLDGGQCVIPVQGVAGTTYEGYVDLGLPSGTLWATCNVGASAPEEYGDYFAWGETEPKEVYNWTTYRWCKGSHLTMTKYCTDGYYGTVDNKKALELADDAAYVILGPSWRMPSTEQQKELRSKCTWQWTTRNGVNGYLVTGPNWNSLFLPATGFRTNNSLAEDGIGGYSWSNLLFSGGNEAFYMYISSDSYTSHAGYRAVGLTVRAVRVSPANDQRLFIEQQSIDMSEVFIGETCTRELTIVNNTNDTQTLTVTADAPFSFMQDEGCVSSMTVEVPSKSCAPVIVVFTAIESGEFNGNVTFQNSALDGGQSVIPIKASAIQDSYSHDEWVDLGLPSGTLWATKNVGANSPEECGDYFAWGETAAKATYTWDNYQWCNGSYNTITKYCSDSSLGTVDNKRELDVEDDAAYVNLDSAWRMPTSEQLQELASRLTCTWEWTTFNGVRGYKVTGPNGKSLFLPAAGYYSNARHDYGSNGLYWSRELDWNWSGNPFSLYFDRINPYMIYDYQRFVGLPIRAVRVAPTGRES